MFMLRNESGRDGEVGCCRVPVFERASQAAERKVTARRDWQHAELVGQRLGLQGSTRGHPRAEAGPRPPQSRPGAGAPRPPSRVRRPFPQLPRLSGRRVTRPATFRRAVAPGPTVDGTGRGRPSLRDPRSLMWLARDTRDRPPSVRTTRAPSPVPGTSSGATPRICLVSQSPAAWSAHRRASAKSPLRASAIPR